jgi:hypothetical protein
LFHFSRSEEQVKKAFCYQILFWSFTVWINCSSDLKNFENYRPSASNFKSFSQSLEQFFLTVGQNNFGNKILFSNVAAMHQQNIFSNSNWILEIICLRLEKCPEIPQWWGREWNARFSTPPNLREKKFFLTSTFH